MPLNVDFAGPGILDITLSSEEPLKDVRIKISTALGYIVHDEKASSDSTQVMLHGPDEPIARDTILHVEYSQNFMGIKKNIDIVGNDLWNVYDQNEEDGQIWKRRQDKVELRVKLGDPFRPTTERIFEVCPRFRILVMGKTGVGKSSLINKVFGITDALVSHRIPGEADINREFTSEKNPRLVLHDSRGFEPGEDDNFQIVRDFIKRRAEEPEIKKKLHAVWLCIQPSSLGGRMLETGITNFLRLKESGELGNVPIVVIFTKYDENVTLARLAIMREKGKSTLEEARRIADNTLRQDFFLPFEQAVGTNMPYLSVSIKPNYDDTLHDLVKITFENVGGYIADAGIVTGISQRINAQVKIRTSIEVGKRGHWKQLTSGSGSSITLEKYLNIIHQDVITVWNMEDKEQLLFSPKFRHIMLNTIDEWEKSLDRTSSTRKIRGAVKAIAIALAGPVGPIALTMRLLATNWVHDSFHKTPANLRRVMIYIVNLTIVMQNLFWIQNILAMKPKKGDAKASDEVTVPIKRKFVNLAVNLYIDAPDRRALLNEIDLHTVGLRSYLQSVSDSKHHETVNKIIDLIEESTITDQDALAEQIGLKTDKSWLSEEDESWDLPVEK